MIPASLNTMLMNQPVSGGGFLPSDISTIAGWWDANDSSTITLSGTNVTGWADKSGLSRNLTVIATPPIYQENDTIANNNPSIGSDVSNVNKGLIFNSNITLTHIYIVCYYKTGIEATFTEFATLVSGGTTFSGQERIQGNSGTANLISTGAFASTVSKNGALATPTILPLPFTVCKFVAASPITQIYSFGYNRGADFRAWIGSYSEIVVCNGAPTPEEETNLLNYLYAKWGITP